MQEGPLSLIITPLNGIHKTIRSEAQNSMKRNNSVALKDNEQNNKRLKQARSEPEKEQDKELMSTKKKIEINSSYPEKSKTRKDNIVTNIKDQMNEHNSSELPVEDIDDSLLDVPSSDDEKDWEQEEPNTKEKLLDS